MRETPPKMVGHSSIQPKVRTNGKEKERPNIRSSPSPSPGSLLKPISGIPPALSESPTDSPFPQLPQPSGGGAGIRRGVVPPIRAPRRSGLATGRSSRAAWPSLIIEEGTLRRKLFWLPRWDLFAVNSRFIEEAASWIHAACSAKFFWLSDCPVRIDEIVLVNLNSVHMLFSDSAA